MKSLLLLLIPCLAFAADDTFQFLPKAQEQKPVVEDQSIDLLLFGFSHHSNRAPKYNSTNEGLGLTYSYKPNPLKDNTEIIVSAGEYLDSFNERATFALVGMRLLLLGSPHSFYTTFSLSVGPYHGSGVPSFGVIPVVSIGYDKFSLNITGDYCKDSNSYNNDGSINKYNCTTSMVAVFLGIKILTW